MKNQVPSGSAARNELHSILNEILSTLDIASPADVARGRSELKQMTKDSIEAGNTAKRSILGKINSEVKNEE